MGPPAGFAAAFGGGKKSWQNFKKLDVLFTEKVKSKPRIARIGTDKGKESYSNQNANWQNTLACSVCSDSHVTGGKFAKIDR
ncbi:hypothetical protein SBDP1_1630003 [Syntrophobacter sp. SbD1]|nr:hypothetical protein SBDP1_1630003 [Syntrophobacter sp. SbD1]